MGKASLPRDVLLFSSLLYREEECAFSACKALEARFGAPRYTSAPLAFSFSDYYAREMGHPLQRRVLAFEDLVPRDALPEIKLATNAIEESLAREKARTVNIDPGLLSLENVCLATTKPYSHRIYLRYGIWAEVTLIYRGNSYQALEWTYPDYASDNMIYIFNLLREKYREQRQCPEA